MHKLQGSYIALKIWLQYKLNLSGMHLVWSRLQILLKGVPPLGGGRGGGGMTNLLICPYDLVPKISSPIRYAIGIIFIPDYQEVGAVSCTKHFLVQLLSCCTNHLLVVNGRMGPCSLHLNSCSSLVPWQHKSLDFYLVSVSALAARYFLTVLSFVIFYCLVLPTKGKGREVCVISADYKVNFLQLTRTSSRL